MFQLTKDGHLKCNDLNFGFRSTMEICDKNEYQFFKNLD